MRIAFAAAALVLAASAAAQTPPQGQLGARTTSPAEMLSQIEQDDLAEALAAAAAHPLGTRENPVRVGGPEGERAYIARLRCPGGAEPAVGPRRDAGVGGFGTVVASYALDCGTTRFDLVMDMYHEEHREERAPAGFAILP